MILKNNEYRIQRVIELQQGPVEEVYYIIDQKKYFFGIGYWKRLEMPFGDERSSRVFSSHQGAVIYLRQTRPYAVIVSPLEDNLEYIPQTIGSELETTINNVEGKDLYLYQLQTKLPNGDYWVIATDPTTAQQKLEKILDEADYGYTDQRKVERIQVIAKGITDTRFIQDKKLIL